MKIRLIDFGGKRRVFGFNNRVNGYLDVNRKAHSSDLEVKA